MYILLTLFSFNIYFQISILRLYQTNRMILKMLGQNKTQNPKRTSRPIFFFFIKLSYKNNNFHPT